MFAFTVSSSIYECVSLYAWCGKITPVYKMASAREIFGVNWMNAEVFYELSSTSLDRLHRFDWFKQSGYFEVCETEF